MKRILFIVALLGVSFGVSAQTWTLEQCIRHALENNLSIRQGELSVQQSEIELNSAQNRRLPGLSASVSESFSGATDRSEQLLSVNLYDTGSFFSIFNLNLPWVIVR